MCVPLSQEASTASVIGMQGGAGSGGRWGGVSKVVIEAIV